MRNRIIASTRKSTNERRGEPFAALVLRWRSQRNLSRADASRLLGIPYRTIEDWEAGRHTPRGISLQLIVRKLSRKR